MVRSPAFKILLLLVGFVWWSIAFVALYSAQSVGCGWGWHLETSFAGLSFLRAVLIGLFAFFCGGGLLIALLFLKSSRSDRDDPETGAPTMFLEKSGALAAYAAAVATLLTFAPILYASPCS
jgi:Flp pilus assembly protein protease CpaA